MPMQQSPHCQHYFTWTYLYTFDLGFCLMASTWDETLVKNGNTDFKLVLIARTQQTSPLLFLLSDQQRTLSVRWGDLLLEFRTPSLFALLPNAGFILLILTLKKCTLTYSDRHLGEKCNYTPQPRRPKLWLYLICRPTGC